MSVDQEVAWGRVADQDVQDNLRLYSEVPELTVLVRSLGEELASHTERPELPWTFRVLDEPAVNAFALPGGHVYVTRGLLAHLMSRDELAAVLGHELGHVAARHAAIEMRNNQAAQRRIQFISAMVDPNRQHVAAVAARSARIDLLAYGREGELEADLLGLTYLQQTTYEPAAFLTVFDLLGEVAVDSEHVPSWLSTHPEPEQRSRALAAKIGDPDTGDAPQVDAAYISMLAGVVHGLDPREGTMRDDRYYHGRVGFAVDLPPGWALEQDQTGVTGLASDNLTQIGVAPKFYTYTTASKATEAFFISGIFRRHDTTTTQVGGSAMLVTDFSIPTRMGDWLGRVGFVDFDGHVAVIMASAPATIWPQQADLIATTFGSFRPLDETERLSLAPHRIEIAELAEPGTLHDFHEAHPSTTSVAELAILNRVDPDEVLPAGRPIKFVSGAAAAVPAAK